MGYDEDESIEGIQKLRLGEGHEDCLDRCIYCGKCKSFCPVDARPAALLLERLRDRRKMEGSVPTIFAYYLNGAAQLGFEENYFKDIYL
jgi:Fe-S oxidoreductase